MAIYRYSLKISAQSFSNNRLAEPNSELPGTTYYSDGSFVSGFYSGTFLEAGETLYFSESERLNLSNYNTFTQPSPPFLTTSSANLEICTGNSTRLTATSNNTIYWYTTPPPLGIPVGMGTSYITPELTTGYYTFYAVADNGGIKSEVSAMEVVMVYPTPVLNVFSNISTLCSKETATLTVSGTTYYEWENGPVASQMTIRPTTTQSYKVTGINTAGCKSTVVCTQLVEACTFHDQSQVSSKLSAANDIPNEERLFSVFPNPNNGDFNIRVNSISESTRVEIYNGIGALIHSDKVTSELTAVTLKNFSNGIYIVRIIENDKVLKQEKIVKE